MIVTTQQKEEWKQICGPQRSAAVHSHMHAGLMHDRWLQVTVGSPGYADSKNTEGMQTQLLESVIKASQSQMQLNSPYCVAYKEWCDQFTNNNGTTRPGRQTAAGPIRCRFTGRMAIGLGDSSPTEVGIRLHHTYGVPWIPGSSLKGVMSNYCDLVWGRRRYDKPTSIKRFDENGSELEANVDDDTLRFRKRRKGDPTCDSIGNYHELFFGTTNGSGFLDVMDGWIEPESLRPDSGLIHTGITPHHQDYYQGKDVPPTDFDSPIPISFLAVTGTFNFWLVWNGDEGDNGWLKIARQLLTETLKNWGIGAKTRKGWGRAEEC